MTYLELIEKGLDDLDNDKLFQEIVVKAETELNLNDVTLATEIQMSVPTVKRWRSGETTPYPLMRRGIYRWFKMRAEKNDR